MQHRCDRRVASNSGPDGPSAWRDRIGRLVSHLTDEKALADAVATAGYEAALVRHLAHVEDSADGSEQLDPRWSGRP